jgi:hypothetical protein
VQASPFISTSTSARLATAYAFGKLNKPTGKVNRTVGLIGRILAFVASVEQLVRAKTYSIPELQQQGKIIISRDMRQDELTFTAHIPGEYLRATLDVRAGDDESAVAGNATGRAQAEAQRFGGLK